MTLRDRHYDLLADHARMIHSQDASAKTIGKDLSKNLIQLDALGWQLREEDSLFKTVLESWDNTCAQNKPGSWREVV